jgi:hypothetical protein
VPIRPHDFGPEVCEHHEARRRPGMAELQHAQARERQILLFGAWHRSRSSDVTRRTYSRPGQTHQQYEVRQGEKASASVLATVPALIPMFVGQRCIVK